jgi:hypothetical protein
VAGYLTFYTIMKNGIESYDHLSHQTLTKYLKISHAPKLSGVTDVLMKIKNCHFKILLHKNYF